MFDEYSDLIINIQNLKNEYENKKDDSIKREMEYSIYKLCSTGLDKEYNKVLFPFDKDYIVYKNAKDKKTKDRKPPSYEEIIERIFLYKLQSLIDDVNDSDDLKQTCLMYLYESIYTYDINSPISFVDYSSSYIIENTKTFLKSNSIKCLIYKDYESIEQLLKEKEKNNYIQYGKKSQKLKKNQLYIEAGYDNYKEVLENALTEEEHYIFKLFKFESKTAKELSKIVNYTDKEIYNIIERCIRKIKKYQKKNNLL